MSQSYPLSKRKSADGALLWTVIDWRKVRQQVEAAQRTIAEAAAERDLEKIETLQENLVHSLYARMLAVRTVSQNRGSRTPGIDRVRWTDPADLFAEIFSVETDEYRACPLRRIAIPTGRNGKTRPISIPTLDDRVVQTLYALALQPVAEVWGDRHSFGFRRDRSTKDACVSLGSVLEKRSAPAWVLEGDIRHCFDTISHAWLCRHIPMNKKILREILESGYIEHGRHHPTGVGVAQGGPLSPILANMTLDGMEPLLNATFRRKKVHLVRYADDFVVTADSGATARLVRDIIAAFLSERGMALSDEKTKITKISDGFDFLGWHFRKCEGDLVIAPTAQSIERIKARVRTLLRARPHADPDALIRDLNAAVKGWCGYHDHIRANGTFASLDRFLLTEMSRWEQANRQAVVRSPVESGGWTFSAARKRLVRFSDTPYKSHPCFGDDICTSRGACRTETILQEQSYLVL